MGVRGIVYKQQDPVSLCVFLLHTRRCRVSLFLLLCRGGRMMEDEAAADHQASVARQFESWPLEKNYIRPGSC